MKTFHARCGCGVLVAVTQCGAAAFVAANAAAQYPERPLRFVVPQAAGSASDTSARIIGHELTRILGR
jgi:tripartite-type tricarboxylate transporter receptor subunit TctC